MRERDTARWRLLLHSTGFRHWAEAWSLQLSQCRGRLFLSSPGWDGLPSALGIDERLPHVGEDGSPQACDDVDASLAVEPRRGVEVLAEVRLAARL